ncbi:protein translocase subunit SecD [Candidatus Shapirobacteria bacterium]|nr:protein translocase subunit SecD [Candidatus Shapirobacteria bacterium]
MKKKPSLILGLIAVLSLVSFFIAFFQPDLNFNLGPLKIRKELYLRKGLDLAGGVHLVFRVKSEDLNEENREIALVSLRENIDRRVNLFGISESRVWITKALSEDHLIVEIPGEIDPTQAVALLGQTAQLNFQLEAELPPEATASATVYDLFSVETELTGANLTQAEVKFDPNTGKPQVGLSFNDQGRELFGKLTQENVEKRIAIFLDNFLLSAPVVKEPILDGQAVISGEFELDQAKQMVSQLNAGALPVEIELVLQERVDPSLGGESIRKGVMAGLVGIVLVAFFMVLFYKFLGFLAVLGLIIYTLLSLALYKLIPVTLTMSGIAGFLLSLGMAVDSNILIFERMKEEVRAGKNKLVAMELGFGRAWDSIRDANVCTLIICFVLFNPFDWGFLNSSSLIRGFAFTLGLGVILEMFTGIVVVRAIMRSFYKPKEIKK